MTAKRARIKANEFAAWPPKWKLPASWECIKRVRARRFAAHGETCELTRLRRRYYFRIVRRRSPITPLTTRHDLIVRGRQRGSYTRRGPQKYIFAPSQDEYWRFSVYHLSQVTSTRKMVWFTRADSVSEIIESLVGRDWRAIRKPKPGLDNQI